MTRNERALASGERLEAAEARVSKARAVFFPDVEVSGAWTHRPYERTTTVGGEQVVLSKYDAFNSTFTAKQVLFDARAFPVLKQTRSERDAARFEAAEQRRIVAFEASAAFLMTLGYEQVAAAAERRVELARQTLADARARFEAQIAGSNDVTRAELEVASAEREATRARNEEQTSRLALANLLVAPVPARLDVPVALLSPPAELGTGDGDLVETARQLRFDVAAQKKRAEAFLYYAKEPMNRFFPSLVGRADGRWTNEAGLSGRNTTWTYGIDLSWSLFDSTISFADTRERKALARASVPRGAGPRARRRARREDGPRHARERPRSRRAGRRRPRGGPEERLRDEHPLPRGARERPLRRRREPEPLRGRRGADARALHPRRRRPRPLRRPGPRPGRKGAPSVKTCRTLVLALATGASALVLSCSGGGDKQGAGGGKGGPPAFPVETAEVKSRPVEYTVTAVGSVEAFEKVQVTARVAGVVEQVRFVEGESVEAGDGPRRDRAGPLPARRRRGAGERSQKAEASKADAEAALARREAVVEKNPGLIPGEEIATFATRVQTAAADVATGEGRRSTRPS